MDKKPSEHAEQVVIFKWARLSENKYPFLKYMYSTLNGVRLNMGQARRAKASGNKRGVPDIVLPYPSDGYHGLYIELKIPGNYPSKEQKEYIAYLNRVGYFAVACYGADDAIQTINNYINGKETMVA